MALLIALLFSPIFADPSCHHVTDQASTMLTDREGQVVHGGTSCLKGKAVTTNYRGTCKSKTTSKTDTKKADPFANEELIGKLHFNCNSSKVRTDAQDMLMNAAQELGESAYKKVILRGFADQSGRKSYNKKLSLKRARKVKNWLAQWGIPADKMSVQALGESTVKNRQAARRVEIKVIR